MLDVCNASASYDFNSFNNVSSSFRLTQNGFDANSASANVFTDFNNAVNNTTYSSTSNSHTKIDASTGVLITRINLKKKAKS